MEQKIEIDIIRNLEDLRASFALRRQEFVEKQSVKENLEFDGNDFSGTHIIAKKDNQIAAVMRLRYFSDFVRLERFCKNPELRIPGLIDNVLEYTRDFISHKGYAQTHCFCKEGLYRHWLEKGHDPLPDAALLDLGGIKLYPVSLRIPPAENPVKLSSTAEIIAAPEGRNHIGELFAEGQFLPAVTPAKQPGYEVSIVRTLPEMENLLEFQQKHNPKLLQDGNNLTATHLVCSRRNEIAASLRIRYFRDFAKLENFCAAAGQPVEPAAAALYAYAEEFLSAKGYRHTLAYSSQMRMPEELHPLSLAQPLTCDNRIGFPFSLNLSPHNRVSIKSHPDILIAAEGEWLLPKEPEQTRNTRAIIINRHKEHYSK